MDPHPFKYTYISRLHVIVYFQTGAHTYILYKRTYIHTVYTYLHTYIPHKRTYIHAYMYTQGGGVHQLWRVEWDERERCEHSLRAYECSGPQLITGGRSGRCTLLSSYTWCMYVCMNCTWLKCIFYLVRTTCDGRQWRHLRYWARTRSHSSNLWELSRLGKSTFYITSYVAVEDVCVCGIALFTLFVFFY